MQVKEDSDRTKVTLIHSWLQTVRCAPLQPHGTFTQQTRSFFMRTDNTEDWEMNPT